MKVIVTDAQQRIALHVIQYLGRKGIYVIAIEKKMPIRISISGFLSRYAKEKHYCPDPEVSAVKFISFINKLTKNEEVVLIPIKNKTIELLLENRKKLLKQIRLPFVNIKTFRIATDKVRLIKFAMKNKIPTPSTYFVKSLSKLEMLSEKLKYPVVIKLRKELNIFQERRYVVVYSRDKFIDEYMKMHKNIQEYPLVQEFVGGRGKGFHAILDKNQKPLGIFMHRRLREYPISGGPSTLSEGIYDPRLKKYGLKLLKKLKWYGIAMVEFKEDRNGTPRLMEINPRFWGTFPLAAESGVDFSWLLYNLGRGFKEKPILKYKVGLKLRFLFSDLKALEEYLIKGDNKLNHLKNFVSGFFDKDVKEGNISKDDVLPVMPFLLEYLRHLAKGPFSLPRVVIKK